MLRAALSVVHIINTISKNDLLSKIQWIHLKLLQNCKLFKLVLWNFFLLNERRWNYLWEFLGKWEILRVWQKRCTWQIWNSAKSLLSTCSVEAGHSEFSFWISSQGSWIMCFWYSSFLQIKYLHICYCNNSNTIYVIAQQSSITWNQQWLKDSMYRFWGVFGWHPLQPESVSGDQPQALSWLGLVWHRKHEWSCSWGRICTQMWK